MGKEQEIKQPLILYGAGGRAQKGLDYARFAGYEPLCFADADERKWGTQCLGLPVMGLRDALGKFGGDTPLYVTLKEGTKGVVFEELTGEWKLPAAQILGYEPTAARRSCRYLENWLVYSYGSMGACCTEEQAGAAPPGIPLEEGEAFSGAFERFLRFREQLICDNQIPGKETPCTGCPDLVPGRWPEQSRIGRLQLNGSDPCQLSCIYCTQECSARCPKSERFLRDKPDFAAGIRHLAEKGYLRGDAVIGLASGEISISPHMEEILQAAAPHLSVMQTNGILFKESMARLAAKPGNKINLSLDSGTRETYAKVKGLDKYDQVVENLFRYRRQGAALELKYIIRAENSREKDLEGFLDLCQKLEVQSLIISRDKNIPPDENIRLAMAYLQDGARERGIPATSHFFIVNESGRYSM